MSAANLLKGLGLLIGIGLLKSCSNKVEIEGLVARFDLSAVEQSMPLESLTEACFAASKEGADLFYSPFAVNLQVSDTASFRKRIQLLAAHENISVLAAYRVKGRKRLHWVRGGYFPLNPKRTDRLIRREQERFQLLEGYPGLSLTLFPSGHHRDP